MGAIGLHAKLSANVISINSDETIIESQSKIEYFGYNRMQSKSWCQQGIVPFR